MTIAVRNPRTGEADYAIEAVSPAEIAAVAGRLRTAQPAWQALGAGVDGSVNAMEVFGGELIAGGAFGATNPIFLRR